MRYLIIFILSFPVFASEEISFDVDGGKIETIGYPPYKSMDGLSCDFELREYILDDKWLPLVGVLIGDDEKKERLVRVKLGFTPDEEAFSYGVYFYDEEGKESQIVWTKSLLDFNKFKIVLLKIDDGEVFYEFKATKTYSRGVLKLKQNVDSSKFSIQASGVKGGANCKEINNAVNAG